MTATSLIIPAIIVNSPRPNVAINAALACLITCSLYSIGKGSERTAISRDTYNTPSDTYAAVVLPQWPLGARVHREYGIYIVH